jgi:hypothetical protein
MRSIPILIALVLPVAALAQAPLTREPAGEPRKNQKIERLHSEDGGGSIDELRVGGQTQAVTVQPKADVPPYEMQPSDMARTRPADNREGMAHRTPRVWKLFDF